jgi:hypothetical protein
MGLRHKTLFVPLACALVLSWAASCFAQNPEVQKQNILTLSRWIAAGYLDDTEIKDALPVLKRQVWLLKQEYSAAKQACPAVYAQMDDKFFYSLKKEYEFKADNSPLLNRLFISSGAGAGKRNAARPWLDMQENFIDSLQNELFISYPPGEGTPGEDLTKPDIFAAPQIGPVVEMVKGSLASAPGELFNPSGAYEAVHKGSTSKGTSLDNTDFDFDLVFDEQKDLDMLAGKTGPFMDKLGAKWKAGGYDILSSHARSFSGKVLLNFIVSGKDGIVIRVQILCFRREPTYSDAFRSQMEQVEKLGGSWDYLKGQIILFKRLVKDILHSYGKSTGGLDGMECEQFIIQAGSSSDSGRRIKSTGSFDKTMRWIYGIGFDRRSGAIIPFEKAQRRSGIYCQDDQKTKLLVYAPSLWNKLVNASRKYLQLGRQEMTYRDFAGLGYTLSDAAGYRKGSNYAVEVSSPENPQDFRDEIFSAVIPAVGDILKSPFTESDIENVDRGRYFLFFDTAEPAMMKQRLKQIGVPVKAQYIRTKEP